MADPNRSGSSPLDLACLGLSADELQQLRTLQAGASPSATSGGAAPLAVHPGPAASSACNDVHGQLEGAPQMPFKRTLDELTSKAQALISEQCDLQHRVAKKKAVVALQALHRQTSQGRVEEYFSSRRVSGAMDKRACVHFSVCCKLCFIVCVLTHVQVYCQELAAGEDYSAPLQALKDVIVSGTQMKLPGLTCVLSSPPPIVAPTHLTRVPPAVLHSATPVCWVRASYFKRRSLSRKSHFFHILVLFTTHVA